MITNPELRHPVDGVVVQGGVGAVGAVEHPGGGVTHPHLKAHKHLQSTKTQGRFHWTARVVCVCVCGRACVCV